MIDLNLFCGGDIHKYLNKPFNDADYTYATNGHLMVRVPYIPGYDAGEEKLTLSCQKFFDGIEELKQFVPMPSYQKPELTKCFECRGTGKTTNEHCPDCDGTGKTECHECDSEIDCKNCDGEGTIEGTKEKTCEDCEGKGKYYEDNGKTKFCKVYASAKSLDLFATLPNVCVVKPMDPEKQIMFRFDGGYGLLMPMRY